MAAERSNRLADETSPYLLQHSRNPVDWYPWGEAALQRARDEDRPILLSIGYAACHWCHVMEHESFEHPATAALMNREFVCIKVDREERPDIDDIYMRAVQLMTGHGGWPLTCFLTPDLRPFWGGTYFPPEPRGGMPAFRDVLAGVADAYKQRRGHVEQVADQLRDQLRTRHPAGGAAELLGHDLVYRAASELHDRFDPNWGGFGGAPKFPNATGIQLLLRMAHHHRDQELADAALFSLDQMAAGGIHDHVGGGFHRYATDARWLVPHFEKMLYDNALLAGAYLDAYRLSGEERFATVVRSTCDWVLRDMRTAEGGFASTLDADSEGVEGKFYVWSQAEIEAELGERAAAFCAAHGVTAGGNWEGTNILHLPRPLAETAATLGIDAQQLQAQLRQDRQHLLETRAMRPRPGLDDKVLADWNGLMIASLAAASRVLADPSYLGAAVKAADFVLEHMRKGGRLMHSWRAGEARVPGFLDDYAAMLGACVELYLTTFEARWLRRARALGEAMIVLFWDEVDGGFFLTGVDHEQLLTRPKPTFDGATPSGNALAVTWLQRLAAVLDDAELAGRATQTLYAMAPQMRRVPSGFTQTMLALDEHLAERREIVLVGGVDAAPTRSALSQLWQRYAPYDLVAVFDPQHGDAAELGRLALFADKTAVAGASGPTFYVCRNYACAAPGTDLEAVLAGQD